MVRSLTVLSFLFAFVVGNTLGFVHVVPQGASRGTKAARWGASPSHPVGAAIVPSSSCNRVDVMTMAAGPAVLDRPDTKTRESETKRERKSRDTEDPVKERKGMGSQGWEVRIYNDSLNTREHVARSLVQVTGMSEINAYNTMMQAHQHGIAVVGRWAFEIAEMYHDALRKQGVICDIVPVDDE